MSDWSLHHQLIVCWPRHTTPPLVLFLVTLSPAQSESVNTVIPSDSLWNLYLIATLGFPFQVSYYAFDKLFFPLWGSPCG